MKAKLVVRNLLFALLITSLMLIGFSLLLSRIRIQSNGTIKTLNLECDTAVIDWGLLEPNQTVAYTINLALRGDVNATLSMYTSSWVPANASQYINLTWSYSGEILQPGTWIPIDLYLYVSKDITKVESFSFDIWIIAEEYS